MAKTVRYEIAAAIRVTDLEILRTGEAAEFERDAATQGRLFHIVKFPLVDADGSVYATGTMGTDVSERAGISRLVIRRCRRQRNK